MNSDFSVDHQDLDDMTCQLCLARAATHRLTDRSPAARSDRYYCSQCYEAKYLKSPPPDHGFPRPRFAIKNVMVLVALFSVPNAIAAWVMRSGYITGTPVELRQLNIYVMPNELVKVSLASVRATSNAAPLPVLVDRAGGGRGSASG